MKPSSFGVKTDRSLLPSFTLTANFSVVPVQSLCVLFAVAALLRAHSKGEGDVPGCGMLEDARVREGDVSAQTFTACEWTLDFQHSIRMRTETNDSSMFVKFLSKPTSGHGSNDQRSTYLIYSPLIASLFSNWTWGFALLLHLYSVLRVLATSF